MCGMRFPLELANSRPPAAQEVPETTQRDMVNVRLRLFLDRVSHIRGEQSTYQPIDYVNNFLGDRNATYTRKVCEQRFVLRFAPT
jgi:hypothetical protein